MHLIGKACPVALLKTPSGEVRFYPLLPTALSKTLAPSFSDRFNSVELSRSYARLMLLLGAVLAIFVSIAITVSINRLPGSYILTASGVAMVILALMAVRVIHMITQESKELPRRLTYELNQEQFKLLEKTWSPKYLDTESFEWKMLEAAVMDQIGEEERYRNSSLIALREILKPEKLNPVAKGILDIYTWITQPLRDGESKLSSKRIAHVNRLSMSLSSELVPLIKQEIDQVRQDSPN